MSLCSLASARARVPPVPFPLLALSLSLLFFLGRSRVGFFWFLSLVSLFPFVCVCGFLSFCCWCVCVCVCVFACVSFCACFLFLLFFSFFSSFLAGLWVLQSAGSPLIRTRTVKVLGPGPCGLAWRCGNCSRAFPFGEGPEAQGHPAPFSSFLRFPFFLFPLSSFFLFFFGVRSFCACSFLCPVLLLKNGVTRHAHVM